MSKGIFILILSCLFIKLPALVVAQPSDWQNPDPSQFNYSATVVANVLVDGSWESDPANALAFIKDGQIRGLGNSIPTDSGLVYYTTIYSNTPVNDLDVRFYHAASDQVLIAFSDFQFNLYASTGSVDQPFTFRVFSDNDAPVKIAEIPSQLTLQGFSFPEIDLNDFLLTIDGDPVQWSAEDHPELTVVIEDTDLSVTPSPGFFGETSIWIAVTELTPNAKSDTLQLDLSIAQSYSGPLLDVVPGQGVMKGNEFRNLCEETETVLRDLSEFEIQSDSCVFYDYLPVIEQNPNPDPLPDWEFSGFYPNSMTILAEAYYSPNYRFLSENDLLAAFIDGELRAVTGPVQNGDRWVFYLNIAGQARDSEVELRYFSSEMDRILTFPETIKFKPYAILGDWSNPLPLDFIPVQAEIDDNGLVEVEVRDTGWIGDHPFIFYARDCRFPQFLYDSTVVSYCVADDSTELNYYYLIGEERGFSSQTLFTRSCTPPEGYVDILAFNCSHDVVIDVENACSLPIPDLRLNLDDLDNCGASEFSGISQVPAPNSDLIQVADTINVFMFREVENGSNEFCDFQLILENFGEELTLNCPEMVEVNALEGDCEAFLDLTVEYTLGCGPTTVTNDYTENGADASGWYPLDSTEVAFSLWEDDEIADSCQVLVLVQDVQIPDIDCPENRLVEVDSGSCVATEVDLGEVVVWMACGSASETNNAPLEYEIGETEVLWTAIGYNNQTAHCTQLITVEDNQPPTITCPEDTTVEVDPGTCHLSGFEPSGLTATAVCGDVLIDYEIPAILPHGVNQIVYTAVGSNGIEVECSQLVTVEGVGDIAIECPENMEIILDEGECEILDPDPGVPLVEGNCVPIDISNDVPLAIFHGTTQVVHTVTAPDGSEVSCTQDIVVLDEQIPVIQCPSDTVLTADPGACGTTNYVLESAEGYMDCGTVNVSDNSPLFFPIGLTEVTYTAIGYNGQIAECSQEVLVIDEEAPELDCPQDISLLIPFGHTGGFVQLELAEAFDNCQLDSLYNSFNAGGGNASDTYPLGVTTVVFTAVDASSNSVECEMTVTITEAAQELDTFYISGQISTWEGYPVEGVELDMQGGTSGEFSNTTGDYELQVFENQTAIIIPQKDEGWLDGLSTLDLVLIQGHIIGLAPLDGPYSIIAGDANNDGVVSTFDLVLLQSLIIGQIDEISGNSAWRFVPTAYIFDDPQNPLNESFPETKVYAYINQDFDDEDWVAVKTGDASGDAAENGSRESRGHRSFNLIAEEEESGLITVRFYLPTEEFISGYQLEVFADPEKLELLSYSLENSVLPNLTENNFYVDKKEGVLRANWWYAPGKKPGRREVVFEIKVRPLVEGIDVSSHIHAGGAVPRFKNEIYSRNGEVSNAGISWKYNEPKGDFSLFQNEPNPFVMETVIPFNLPEEMPVVLNIYDSGGRNLLSSKLEGQKGMNYYKFIAEENHKGLLYYQLISEKWVGLKKMVVY